MRSTIVSTRLFVMAPPSHPGDTWRSHLSRRIRTDKLFHDRRARWAKNADHAQRMRCSYSSGPPVTALGPSNVVISSCQPIARDRMSVGTPEVHFVLSEVEVRGAVHNIGLIARDLQIPDFAGAQNDILWSGVTIRLPQRRGGTRCKSHRRGRRGGDRNPEALFPPLTHKRAQHVPDHTPQAQRHLRRSLASAGAGC